jgi:transposase
MDVNRLVFLDECGVNTGMSRLYGRAFGGERVVEYVPDCRYENTTILSSMRLSGDTQPVIFEGAVNGNIFKTWVDAFLVPSLAKDDIVVMDNLSSHKGISVIQSIERVGASVMFLPEYSPDLSPIEPMWSKVKSVIRSLKVRSFDDLTPAVIAAFDSISTDDILGWFIHCGYFVPSANQPSAL